VKIQRAVKFRGMHLGSRIRISRRIFRFVQEICQRRALPRLGAWRMLDLILRKSNPMIMLQRVQREGDFFFAPRLVLAIISLANPSKDGNQQAPQPRLALAREQIILRKYQNSSRFVTTERMLCQITSHCERVEIWSRTPRPDLRQATPARRATLTQVQPNIASSRPPVKIFRRSPSVEIENTTAAPQPFRSEPAAKLSMKTNVNARPIEATVDVKRLTDQVIQAIDRRIVAQRERTGRL
jgi:hypothetical protein